MCVEDVRVVDVRVVAVLVAVLVVLWWWGGHLFSFYYVWYVLWHGGV